MCHGHNEIRFTYPTRSSESSLSRRRVWVSAKGIPGRLVTLVVGIFVLERSGAPLPTFRGSMPRNPVHICRTERVKLACKRRACKSSAHRIPDRHIPLELTSMDLKSVSCATGTTKSGSHTPLEVRKARFPGEECGYLPKAYPADL